MIIDKLLSPAIKLPLSGLAIATVTVGTVMDFGAPRNHGLLSTPYGPGWDINIRGATSAGAATLQLLLVTDDNPALSSPAVIYAGPVTALAGLVKLDLLVPVPESDLWERYIAWRVTIGTAVFTAGTLSIEYMANARRYRAYAAQGNQ